MNTIIGPFVVMPGIYYSIYAAYLIYFVIEYNNYPHIIWFDKGQSL